MLYNLSHYLETAELSPLSDMRELSITFILGSKFIKDKPREVLPGGGGQRVLFIVIAQRIIN